MAATEAEAQAQLTNAMRLFQEAREFGEDNTDNVVGMIDTIVQATESEYAAEILRGVDSYRKAANALLNPELGRAIIEPILRTWVRSFNTEGASGDVQTLITRIYDRMISTSDRVLYRNFTRGSASAGGGNVGDGTILRLNVDANNMPLEASHSEVKTARCVQDQNSGAERHEERFVVTGEARGKDLLEVSGSGIQAGLRSLSARDSLLLNPSFSSFSGTISALTELSNWTPTTALSNFTLDESNYYRDFVGDTTPRSLIIGANDSVTQKLSVRGTRLSPNVPTFLQVAYNRQIASADGTLRIRMGSQTATVSLSAQTGWNLLRMAIDQNLWLENWTEDEADIYVGVESGSTFGCRVDDVMFVQWTPIDGSWWLNLGGATPYQIDDTFTFTDTEVGSIIQLFMWRFFRRYLPSASSAVNVSEP